MRNSFVNTEPESTNPQKYFSVFCIDWITMKNDGNALVTTANLKTLSKFEKFEKDIVFNDSGFRVNG